jgi:hypothetical protein
MSDKDLLVRVLRPAPRRFATFRLPGRDVPHLESSDHAFAVHTLADGRPGIRPLDQNELASQFRANSNAVFLAVSTTRQSVTLEFVAIRKDEGGHAWDVALDALYTIREPHMFLDGFALDLMSPETGLSRQVTESWLITILRPVVADVVGRRPMTDIREREALPLTWWKAQVMRGLDQYGLDVTVRKVEWRSADATKAEADQKRIAEMELIARKANLQRELEVQQLKAEAEYEGKKRALETALNLADLDRTHRLQVLELSHREEVLGIQSRIDDAKRAQDIAVLKHEIRMAELRKDQEADARAKERDAASAAHAQREKDLAAQAKAALASLGRLHEPLLQGLAAADAATQHQAAERLTSVEFGFSTHQLAGLGFDVGTQVLVSVLRSKEERDGRQVVLGKSELVTRDLQVLLGKSDLVTRDVGVAKVKALHVGQSLTVRLTTERAGHITLLNIGTSGAVQLHVPNALSTAGAAWAVGGRSYNVPGPVLFPWDGDYFERGPVGWEHIVGIVSDHPLIDPRIVGRSTPEAPLVCLCGDEVRGLIERLESLPAKAWTAGTLSFRVIE